MRGRAPIDLRHLDRVDGALHAIRPSNLRYDLAEDGLDSAVLETGYSEIIAKSPGIDSFVYIPESTAASVQPLQKQFKSLVCSRR